MNNFLITVAGALLAGSAAASAATQAAAPTTAASEDAAKLAEAHAIIGVMYPPAGRAQMIDKMLTDLLAPIRQNMPMDGVTDPGLKKILNDYMDGLFAEERPLIMRHLPAMTDAMAVAYTHEFSLAELKDIHAFAMSPSGSAYFSHALTILGDPAVKKVNADMAVDAQQVAKTTLASLKEKVVAYVKAHPDAAKQLMAAAAKGQ